MEDSQKVVNICKDCAEDRLRSYQERHPDLSDIAKEGDYVKIVFIDSKYEENDLSEWMWVQLKSIHGQSFSGILDNEPIWVQNIHCGDFVLSNFDKVAGYIDKSGNYME